MSNGAVLALRPVGLSLAVSPGETYRTVLNRFNAYRSPYSQITALQTPNGTTINLDSPISGYTVAHVVESQIPSPFTYRSAAPSS
jgi:hypothetical protein